MNNRKKKGVLFTIIGLALIVAALLLTGRNLFEEYLAGKEAEQILSALQDRIPESVPQIKITSISLPKACQYFFRF